MIRLRDEGDLLLLYLQSHIRGRTWNHIYLTYTSQGKIKHWKHYMRSSVCIMLLRLEQSHMPGSRSDSDNGCITTMIPMHLAILVPTWCRIDEMSWWYHASQSIQWRRPWIYRQLNTMVFDHDIFQGMMINVFITWNSSLVPLIEGLCSSNPYGFSFSGFGEMEQAT